MPFKPEPEHKQIFRAPRLDDAMTMTDEIAQPRQTRAQRSFGPPIHDSRTDFPPPIGIQPEGYPSTRVDAPSMGQPLTPTVTPVVELEYEPSEERRVK